MYICISKLIVRRDRKSRVREEKLHRFAYLRKNVYYNKSYVHRGSNFVSVLNQRRYLVNVKRNYYYVNGCFNP